MTGDHTISDWTWTFRMGIFMLLFAAVAGVYGSEVSLTFIYLGAFLCLFALGGPLLAQLARKLLPSRSDEGGDPA